MCLLVCDVTDPSGILLTKVCSKPLLSPLSRHGGTILYLSTTCFKRISAWMTAPHFPYCKTGYIAGAVEPRLGSKNAKTGTLGYSITESGLMWKAWYKGFTIPIRSHPDSPGAARWYCEEVSERCQQTLHPWVVIYPCLVCGETTLELG